jgi:hypothetical protein
VPATPEEFGSTQAAELRRCRCEWPTRRGLATGALRTPGAEPEPMSRHRPTSTKEGPSMRALPVRIDENEFDSLILQMDYSDERAWRDVKVQRAQLWHGEFEPSHQIVDGFLIRSRGDFERWVATIGGRDPAEPFTYVMDLAGELRLAPRRSQYAPALS